MPYREPLTPVEDWAMRGLIALTAAWAALLTWLVARYA